MRRFGWRIAVAAAAGWGMAALLPLGCGEGPGREDQGMLAVVTATCDRLLTCGCVSAQDVEPCRLEIAEAFFAAEELVYDDVCAQAWRRWVSTASCGEPVLPALEDVCPVYHGAVFEGLPCTTEGPFVTDCGPRLWCIGGTCVDPTGRSFGGRDEPCDPLAGCEAGLSCLAGRCGPLPGSGQPCADGECADGSRCEASQDSETGVCVAAAEIGAPCMGHAECASGNCPRGFCEPPASTGDACSSTLPCGPGFFCADGVCQDELAAGFCGTFELFGG